MKLGHTKYAVEKSAALKRDEAKRSNFVFKASHFLMDERPPIHSSVR